MNVGALGDVPRARCGKEGDDAQRRSLSDRQMQVSARAARQLPSKTQTGHVTTSGRGGHRSTGSTKKGMFQNESQGQAH